MHAPIEQLESRLLFSLPSDFFAAANDTYQLTIGTTVPTTAVTSVQWGMTGFAQALGTPDAFVVTLPAGPASLKFFQMAIQGTLQSLVRIESYTAAAKLRARWDLSSAFVNSYQQIQSSDGSTLYDQVSFSFQRITDTVFTPSNGVGTTLDWNFATASGSTPALANTQYMSTAPDVPATFEITRGQVPATNFVFKVELKGSPTALVVTGPSYTTVANLESVPLIGKLIAGSLLADAVYLQRDSQARPVVRDHFTNIRPSRYTLFDTTLDTEPRSESWTYAPRQGQVISYSYDAAGAMAAPASTGWDFQLNSNTFNPTPVTAFIKPPTFGPRNTPLGSINIQFTSPVTTLALSNFSFENMTSTGLTLTTADGGFNWTLGNLAGKQQKDGDYGIELFALTSGLSSGGVALIGSTGIKWTLDTVPPVVSASAFDYMTSQSLRFTFSENVAGSVSPTDLVLQNLTTGATISAASEALVYDAATNTARFAFPGLANATLPDGNYRATLPAAGVTDAALNALSADYTFDFFVLAADANHDRHVDLTDFTILAANFNTTGRTFSQGNFDYDAMGKVDLTDFTILAANFNKSLPASTAPQTATVPPAPAPAALTLAPFPASPSRVVEDPSPLLEQQDIADTLPGGL